jgi:uncharacterized protein (DUF58 family)
VNWDRILRHSQIYNLLVRPRKPEQGVIFLAQRRVYILPTRQGLTFGLSLILMLIGSINYNLSLGYVLTFLLAGMGLVSILHTFRNLAHLYVSAGRVDPVFAGDAAQFELQFENHRPVPRHSIKLACEGAVASCNIPAGRTEPARVAVHAAARGWLQLPRVTLDTRYPLGLFRAWSYVQPEMRALVYPKPDDSPLPLPVAVPDSGDSVLAGTGTDDFAGIRPYRSGDSPRHIAWKSVARGQAMVTKVFSGRSSSELWFDWDSLPDLGMEAKLSRLTRWVLLADQYALHYGLKLPGLEVPLGHGEAQREQCLKELALHEVERNHTAGIAK